MNQLTNEEYKELQDKYSTEENPDWDTENYTWDKLVPQMVRQSKEGQVIIPMKFELLLAGVTGYPVLGIINGN